MTRSNMPCTICGQDHSASSCTSEISSFLKQSDRVRSASRSQSTTKPKPSTDAPTGTTGADAQAPSSRLCTKCDGEIDAAKLMMTNNSYCRECQKAYNREYYRTHKEKWAEDDAPRY